MMLQTGSDVAGIFGPLSKACPMGPVVPNRYVGTSYKIVINRPGFELNLLI
jgi:hypothetical protein